ncbi:Major capsid protein Gp5 [uncultured Caudovirales phage]|uniref:Major capsid protein Gp5 n=1 Tax=uncultured Caudovirales phage TaxID=2100421 RepID=A0A6J5Q2A8_9CAUD|nr:Major capsid protein Gp5 [uncultured Caudovirales phage]CAB4178289.1 Major capsid protein Gp5 [uncultured Caudovirales phage]CAB4188043.1 Major capsid protein Gp5 [uncultured Caudovirales phage]CAB4219374.1 Major capsid protein Gp5 [uncultured Caudovirales phage]
MANSILTIDMITRKCLEILENNLVITRNVNRQYDDSFAVEGAKIGSTLRIRLPDRALVTDGAALQVQDDNEQYTTLTVSNQQHIGVNFTSAELTMQLDDFAERVLKPRVSQLASTVDANVATAYKGIYNSVGTPGTTPATSLVLLQANQKLNEFATPMSPRYATVNPAANAGLVEGMKGLFNPTGTISRQFKNGMMGEGILGLDEINMSQSIVQHTTGVTPVAPIVATTVAAQGATSLAISFTSGSPTFKVGDVFTIGSVYAVNPQTRQTTGSLQQFVVTADVTVSSTTTATLTVQPPMYTPANALATVDSFPLANAVLTFLGGSATTYPQNLIYHKDAITFATADLLLPQGVDMASRQVHNGISLRIVRQYDINNDRMPCRIDVLYGYAAIRPVTAVRLWG